MKNPEQTAQILAEKEILSDFLLSQKLISASYNTYAGECSNPQLRSTFLNILNEEHDIQANIFYRFAVKRLVQDRACRAAEDSAG